MITALRSRRNAGVLIVVECLVATAGIAWYWGLPFWQARRGYELERPSRNAIRRGWHETVAALQEVFVPGKVEPFEVRRARRRVDVHRRYRDFLCRANVTDAQRDAIARAFEQEATGQKATAEQVAKRPRHLRPEDVEGFVALGYAENRVKEILDPAQYAIFLEDVDGGVTMSAYNLYREERFTRCSGGRPVDEPHTEGEETVGAHARMNTGLVR